MATLLVLLKYNTDYSISEANQNNAKFYYWIQFVPFQVIRLSL